MRIQDQKNIVQDSFWNESTIVQPPFLQQESGKSFFRDQDDKFKDFNPDGEMDLGFFSDEIFKPTPKESDSVINCENTSSDVEIIKTEVDTPFESSNAIEDSITESLKSDSTPQTNARLQKVKANKASSPPKTTEFAYLLERKAFRMMRKYYKDKFEFTVDCKDYKKNLPIMSLSEINHLISTFMMKELGSILIIVSQEDFCKIRDGLKTIIFCDRYLKKEQISNGLCFKSLRNVLHKYNSRNLHVFLSETAYSFLFTHFFLKNGKQSVGEQSDVDDVKLTQRMRHLMKEATRYIPDSISMLFEKVYLSQFTSF